MNIENRLINIIVLAVSKLEIKESGNPLPLCLAEIEGQSVLESILGKADTLKKSKFTFVFSEKDAQKFHLSKIASILSPDSSSILASESTRGSLCTSLFAACNLDQNSELLIISANELVDINLGTVIGDFRSRDLDAGTLVFKSIQPRYSYVRIGDNGLVSEAAQRIPISKHATAGIFWFRRAKDFVNGAKVVIKKNTTVDNSFYIAPVFNELILNQQNIGVFHIESEKYRPLKTSEQLKVEISRSSDKN